MGSFADIPSEDLQREWDKLFPEYVSKLKEVRDMMLDIDRIRSKLLLIKTELESRQEKVDDIPEG